MDDITIRMFITAFFMLLWLILFPSTHIPYLLQLECDTRNDFTGLSQIDANEEVQSGPLSAKFLIERSKQWTGDFIEVHELLAIEAYLRRPIFDKRVRLGIWIEVIPELLDDCRLA